MSELNFGRLLRRGALFADDTAVRDLANGHQATFAQHLVRVGRLCGALGALGAAPSDRVGVLATNSHAYIELWHACLAGAGVINPLNTRLAPDEIVYILNDSGTRVLFVDAPFAHVVDELRPRLEDLRTVVLIGSGDAPHDVRYEDLLAAAPLSELPAEPDAAAPAVLMYTGGTTGLPKGVALTQSAVTLSIHRMQPHVRGRPPQSYLAFMPMFHIGGISSWGLFFPSGGRAVTMPQFEPGAVNAAIQSEGITAIGAVPTMLAMMIQQPDFEPEMLSSLQLVMYGAAPMPAELLARLMEMCPGIGFYQAYGMTEAAAIVTGLTPEDHIRGGDILRSVGRPNLGVEVEIRDPASGAPTLQGEVGEIWLRSDSLMTGYWNKPEQTASSLVDGWYRSGDAGRLDAEGYLFMADRVKDMIVTGGENVYSLEVENAISSHPAVEAVAVIGLPDATWGERVHAVVVCGPGSVEPEALARHARAAIAGFKVPKTWTLQRDPLPVSAAGKVLKRDLREREAAALPGPPASSTGS